MAVGWNGADPVEAVDADDYELATEYLVNVDITITHIRVWAGAGEIGIANRKGRIWTTAGAQLGIATMPTDLATGWSTHALDTPVERLAGSRFKVSFMTGGNEGALANALLTAVPSADGAITALASADGTHGNGSFHLSPGSFPTTQSATSAFYGADVVYSLGAGATAPVITALTVTSVGAVATATATVTDAETLTGLSVRMNWDDGTSDTVVTYPTVSAQHTYAASGTYAVLCTATDAGGLADHEATAVTVLVPSTELLPLNAAAIFNGLLSHLKRLGQFSDVLGHEPVNPPTGMVAALTAADLDPVNSSGLSLTSARLELVLRIYLSADMTPRDDADPLLLTATDRVIASITGDFDLGGLLRCVDLLGQEGEPLSGRFGYVKIVSQLHRYVTVRIPLICNDVWEQSP